jgi:hypothetical protein
MGRGGMDGHQRCAGGLPVFQNETARVGGPRYECADFKVYLKDRMAPASSSRTSKTVYSLVIWSRS